MIWLIICAALQVADSALTVLVINGGGRELNPIIRWLMDKLGMIPALAVTKAFLIAYLAWASIPALTIGACAVYAAVVAWNLKEYLENA